jgi:hypothetical protein
MINNSPLGLSALCPLHQTFGLRRASLRYGRPSLPLPLRFGRLPLCIPQPIGYGTSVKTRYSETVAYSLI